MLENKFLETKLIECMSNQLGLQSNVEMIHQSIEEVHALLSALEEQIKSGLLIGQSDIETVEIVAPEEQPLTLEDAAFLADWL